MKKKQLVGESAFFEKKKYLAEESAFFGKKKFKWRNPHYFA